VDKKKKFFIGLGILIIIYAGVLSLNLTHDEESESKKSSKSGYSQDEVIQKIKSDYRDLSKNIELWLTPLLPGLDLFEEPVSADYCTIKKNPEPYILLNGKHPQCVLFVKQSSDSARLALLKYEVISNQASRALNLNMKNRVKLLNTAVMHSKSSLSKSKGKPSEDKSKPPNKWVKTNLSMFFLADVNESEYQCNNPDRKKFQLDNFPAEDNKQQAKFEVVDNEFKLIAPEKGGVLVLKCSGCTNNQIKITAVH